MSWVGAFSKLIFTSGGPVLFYKKQGKVDSEKHVALFLMLNKPRGCTLEL